MSETEKSAPKFRPNPKRQLILVLLALVGLGVGYGLGFVFKRPAAPPPAQTSVAAPGPAKLPAPPQPATSQTAPSRQGAPATQTAVPKPVLPEAIEHHVPDGLRAYEEALPREIVVVMEPLAPAPEPAAEAPALAAGPKPAETLEKPPAKAAAEPPAQGRPAQQQAALPPAEKPAPEPDPAANHRPTEAPIAAQPAGPLPPWRKFAVAATTDARPKIAIVMDDLGIDRVRTRRTMELPAPLTLSFLAYAHDLQKQADSGRGKGHEIWLHVPMEPSSTTIDPGPNVLLTGVPAAERITALKWNLDQLQGFVGINNHMGSRFTANPEGMRGVMAELKKRGLAFLDSVTSPKSVGHVAAREAGVPFMLRNIFLDHEDDRKAVEAQLHKLEVLAAKHGEAVAIGHPREATLAALTPWLGTLGKKGIQLVPASALLRVPRNEIAETTGN